MRTLPPLFVIALLSVAALAAPACVRREVVVTATADTEPEVRARAEFARISAGVDAGLIDRAEAERLARVMARIETYRQRAYADGILSLREQRRLARFHARFDRAITVALSR